MVKIKPKVVIDNLAKAQLKEAYTYTKLDSPKSADKVKAKILVSIKELADHPEKYPKDKYRLNNDGSYRAFEIYKYREVGITCAVTSGMEQNKKFFIFSSN